jgi:hypothetical protein
LVRDIIQEWKVAFNTDHPTWNKTPFHHLAERALSVMQQMFMFGIMCFAKNIETQTKIKCPVRKVWLCVDPCFMLFHMHFWRKRNT